MRAKLALCLLVFLAALAAHSSSALLGGTIWDDEAHILQNEELREPGGLAEIWTDPRSEPQYYPLVHTSFWLEYRAFGTDPRGYHVVNVLLHAASAVLVLCLAWRLALPCAWLVALLFAVHPVQVESVAWITERKNVLSGFFYLAAMLSWWRARPPEASAARGPTRSGWWLLAFLLFAAALLCKTVTSSLPAALLVILWWKRGRLAWSDVLALVPFFLLGLALGLHTSHLERTHVGAAGPEWDFSVLERVLIAGRAAWFYLGKLLWPHPLIFVYPRWSLDATSAAQWALPAAALALLALLVALARRGWRGPLAATLFFGGTLVPALGFFDVYPMRYSFVADHFQYLASLGAFALATAGVARIVRPPALRGALGGAWIVLLGALAWHRGLAYESGERLYLDTLAKNPGAWMPHNNLGLTCLSRGELAEAEEHFTRAVELAPLASEPESNLGAVLELSGRHGAALAHYEQAIALDRRNANARANAVRLRLARGTELAQRGDLDGALVEFERALADDPSSLAARAGVEGARKKLDSQRR